MPAAESRLKQQLPIEKDTSILDRVLAATGVGVYELDASTGAQRFSAACKVIWGLGPEEDATAARIEGLIHPEDRAIALSKARQSLQADGSGEFQLEHRIVRPDGEVRWIQIRGHTEFDDVAGGRRPLRSIGVILDVTERKRTEVAIAAREAEWRTLVDAIPTLAWMADADGWSFWYNQRWYDYTGMSLAELQGWGWESVHDPTELPGIKARWQASIASGQPFEMTFPLRGADGVFRPFLTRIVPLRNDRGEISRWFGTNTDVTPERRLHEQLLASEARLKALFDTVPVGIVISEAPSGRIVEGNRKVEAILGHPVLFSATIDRYCEWVARHEDGRRVEAHEYPLARALAGEARPELEARYQRGDGREAWVRFIGAPIYADERIAGAIVATLDIDREKRALQALDRIREDLEAQVQAEVRARESAQSTLVHAQRMEALGQLAGGIAHDFNNVLQAIAGGLSLVQKRAHHPEDVHRFARMAGEAAARGASVTARLLAFARKGELRAVPVCPKSLLENLREILASTLGAGFTISVEVDEHAPPLLADKAQLETVMVNLAVNARDAMPNGGVLTLSAHAEEIVQPGTDGVALPPGSYLRLALSDTGTGMDAITLARASEPFFTTKKPGEGTGLGLAMARGFAEQSGGSLEISSTVGSGTTVTVWFPRAAPHVTEGGATAAAAVRDFVSSAVILVADDDHMVRDVLVRELEEFGYSIVQASDGLSALECLDKGTKVDLVITDYSMPGMNGLELAQEIRRRHARMPILLLAGYADANVITDVEAMQDDSLGLLRKPLPAEELARHAAMLLIAERA